MESEDSALATRAYISSVRLIPPATQQSRNFALISGPDSGRSGQPFALATSPVVGSTGRRPQAYHGAVVRLRSTIRHNINQFRQARDTLVRQLFPGERGDPHPVA
jgi:hypothetical protein